MVLNSILPSQMISKLYILLLWVLAFTWQVSAQTSQRFVNEDSKPGWACNSSDDPALWVLEATEDWMSRLPDSTLLQNMSIPGSHDSGATIGGAAAECQDWSILEQLNAGIRFLDIRGRRYGRRYAIHHGMFFQNLFFEDVMAQIISFLEDHPQEVIIMNIQEEYIPTGNSISNEALWTYYASKYSKWIFKNPNDLGNYPNPTLGVLRGKIYTFGRDFRSGYGTYYNGGLNDEDFSQQNYYKVYYFAHKYTDPDDRYATLPSKVELAKQYIDIAKSSDIWVVNYLSGSTGMTPYEVAKSVNPPIYDYLGKQVGKQKLGILPMDYPGEKLIYRIIKSNFNTDLPMPPKKLDNDSSATPPNPNSTIAPKTIYVDDNHDQIQIKFEELESNNITQFVLAFDPSISWWKGIKVKNQQGQEIFLLEPAGDPGKGNNKSIEGIPFPYIIFGETVTIEFWKAKVLGVHTYVGETTLKLSEFKGQKITVRWQNE